MLKKIRPVYVAMLLFSVVTALYYPSLLEIFFHPGVFNIDDANLMDFILNHDLQIDEVFSARGSGKYFRPFLELTLLIDQRIWGADAFGFRLTNLFIHAFNTVLVYLAIRLILKNNSRSNDISTLSAIIFGIHPIAVESVAWISGRTDPLATMWGLLALWLYLYATTGIFAHPHPNPLPEREGARLFFPPLQGEGQGGDGWYAKLMTVNVARFYRRWYLFPFSLFCIFASAMSKEVGFAIPIIIAVWEIGYSRIFWNVTQGKQKIIFILSIAVIPAYILLRNIFFDAKDMSLRLIKSGISSDITSSSLAFLASFGFYIKKSLYPFPLELVIESINIPIYAILGFAVIIFFVISIFINSLRKYSFFLFWALLGIGPAALISFTDIAWTRWAERYLYFSLVPLSVMTSMAYFELSDKLSYKTSAKVDENQSHSHLNPLPEGEELILYPPFQGEGQGEDGVRRRFSVEKKRIASIVGICILLSLALATYHRSRLWNDNLKFWEDAYSKSPESINVSVQYANLLIQKEKIDEAGKVLDRAMRLKGPKHQVLYSLGHISWNREDFEKAEGYYENTLDEARADSRFVLEGARFKSRVLLSIGELKIAASGRITDDEQRKNLYLDGVNYFDLAYKENRSDTFLLYRIAKEYLSIGEKEKAVAYFKQYRDVSGDSIYRQAAEKLIRKLE